MKVIAGQLFLCLSVWLSVCLAICLSVCYCVMDHSLVCVCVCLLLPACIHCRTNSFFICSRGRACTLRIRNFITTTQTWASRWSMATAGNQNEWASYPSPLALSLSLCLSLFWTVPQFEASTRMHRIHFALKLLFREQLAEIIVATCASSLDWHP